MSQAFFNIATLAGTLLSLIGVLVAIAQILKTRSAAESAKHAADQAQRLLARNLFLADLSTCTTSIEGLKVLIRNRHHEAALLRVTDLNAALIRLRHLPDGNSPLGTDPDLTPIIAQLAVLRDLLERTVHNAEAEFNPVRINGVLSKVSDKLNDWVGAVTFKQLSENADARN